MDLQATQAAPNVEIVFNTKQDATQSPLTARKSALDKLSPSNSSTSEDDSLGSFRDATNFAGNIIDQFQETIKTFQVYKEERSALDIEGKKDHIEILQHIQTFRQDLGDCKKRIEQTEQLYKILNDGLSAAQQSEALRNRQAISESKTAHEQLDAALHKINTNADCYASVKQQYNELKTQFDKLCTRLVQNPTSSPLLTTIMSTPRLNSARTSGNQTSNTQMDDVTLEDILTQQQEDLIDLKQMMITLNTQTKQEPDYQKTIDELNSKVTTLQNNNHSLMRRVQLWMTASTAVLLTSFWFWWQAHKA